MNKQAVFHGLVVKPLTPFEKISRQQSVVIMGFWILMVVFLWVRVSIYSTVKFIPSPQMVFDALTHLYYEGLIRQFGVSMGLCFQSTFFALLISLAFAYLSPLPFIQPLAEGISKFRYLPMVGITYYLTQLSLSGRPLQLTILTMFVTVYFITSMMSMIAEIPPEEYDLARTMGCSRWEMLWKVVVKGRMDYVIEIFRQNLAITWMMFVTVEIIVMSAGGIGILMKQAEKSANQERILAIQLLIFLLGASIDFALARLKPVIFPYSQSVKSL